MPQRMNLPNCHIEINPNKVMFFMQNSHSFDETVVFLMRNCTTVEMVVAMNVGGHYFILSIRFYFFSNSKSRT